MNEAETRAEHIDPALQAAGWGVVEGEKTHRSVDLLGRVYEYFLTRFASAEGKNGGVAKCEVRSASVEVQTSHPFVIRHS